MSIAVAVLELPEDTEAFVAAMLPLSAAPHRERAASFKSMRRRAEFLAGRRLLALLYQHLGLVFSWPDEQPQSAPPAVVTSAPACSTVTHSGPLVLAAVTTSATMLGIDCECGERHNDLKAIARRHFTQGEATRLENTPSEHRQALFLRHWVLKEAWLKATGQGIGGGFSSVELLDDQSVRVHTLEHGDQWTFWHGRIATSPFALCWSGVADSGPQFLDAELFDEASARLVQSAQVTGAVLDCCTG